MEIQGYVLDETKWKVRGGGGQCNIATKDGKRYFIKKLTAPKYPVSDRFTDDFKKKKIKECRAWLAQRELITRILPGNGTGTLVKPVEYFREGPCYYEVANMVTTANIPLDQIWEKSREDKIRIMLTAAKSLADVHGVGVVHGDLDPGNILFSRERGNIVAKLIDFTDSFFEKEPPETIMSKDFWWSPEVACYSGATRRDPSEFKKYISCKADVFSLGIVFHQYCSEGGNAPICELSEPWRECLDGRRPVVDTRIDVELRRLISSMLELEPNKRPSMAEVCRALERIGSPNLNTRGIRAGNGTRDNGASVEFVQLLDNPGKVRIIFSDGTEQIMDLWFAIRQRYVNENISKLK